MQTMMGRMVQRHSPARVSKRPAKIPKVMHEFKAGTLKSSSGEPVTSRDQAIAIALSEAGMSRRKKR